MLKYIQKVRLSDSEIQAIEHLFRKHFAEGDKLWLFGSRVNLSKKGGDIDLYVETHAKTVKDAMNMRSNFIWDLEQKIGEQKIDLVLNVLNFPYSLPIYSIARTEGVRMV